jgi:hypothetical protein
MNSLILEQRKLCGITNLTMMMLDCYILLGRIRIRFKTGSDLQQRNDEIATLTSSFYIWSYNRHYWRTESGT